MYRVQGHWNQMENSLVTFFWLDMGLTNSQKEWNTFSGTRSLFLEVWLFMILFICAQLCIVFWGKNKKGRKQLEIWLILDSQELFEKWKLVVHSMLRYSRKKVLQKRVCSWTPVRIYLVACGFSHGVCCLFVRTEWNRTGFLPLIANMLFVSNIIFVQKRFLWHSFCTCGFIVLCKY